MSRRMFFLKLVTGVLIILTNSGCVSGSRNEYKYKVFFNPPDLRHVMQPNLEEDARKKFEMVSKEIDTLFLKPTGDSSLESNLLYSKSGLLKPDKEEIVCKLIRIQDGSVLEFERNKNVWRNSVIVEVDRKLVEQVWSQILTEQEKY